MRPLLLPALVWLRRLLDAVAALLLAAVLLITGARVVARYLLGQSMPWSEELTRLLFIWLVLIGAAGAKHLRIDMVPVRLGRGAARRRLEIAVASLSVGMLALLVWKGFGLIALTAYDRYTALDVSLQYLYLSVIVGGGLWIVTTLLSLLEPRGDDPTGKP
jgi:TRAP-type transport system small permease protein